MKPIVIRWSWGETLGLAEAIGVAMRHPGKRVLHNWWWVWREHGRRGIWEPWTLGDHLHLIRLRRYMSRVPRRTVKPGRNRHREG